MNPKYNLKINPENLKILERKAKKLNLSLESYIELLLKRFITFESLIDSYQSTSEQELQQRTIDSLDELLGIKISGFEEQGLNDCCSLISSIYKSECVKKGLSNEEGLKEITPLIKKYFQKRDWDVMINMFKEDTFISKGPEIGSEIFIRYGNRCPLIDLFNEWSGKHPGNLVKSIIECVVL